MCTLAISETSAHVDGEKIMNDAEDEQYEEKQCYFLRLTEIRVVSPRCHWTRLQRRL